MISRENSNQCYWQELQRVGHNWTDLTWRIISPVGFSFTFSLTFPLLSLSWSLSLTLSHNFISTSCPTACTLAMFQTSHPHVFFALLPGTSWTAHPAGSILFKYFICKKTSWAEGIEIFHLLVFSLGFSLGSTYSWAMRKHFHEVWKHSWKCFLADLAKISFYGYFWSVNKRGKHPQGEVASPTESHDP